MTKTLHFHPVRIRIPARTTVFTVVPTAAAAGRHPAAAPGLFARLERETAAGSLPETLAFALLGVTGALWPTWEALRLVFAF